LISWFISVAVCDLGWTSTRTDTMVKSQYCGEVLSLLRTAGSVSRKPWICKKSFFSRILYVLQLHPIPMNFPTYLNSCTSSSKFTYVSTDFIKLEDDLQPTLQSIENLLFTNINFLK
jgi:hypothetical protein